jgi:hypothetical protein
MAEVQIFSKLGRKKGKPFQSDVRPDDARAALDLLRSHGVEGGSIKIRKDNRSSWRTYRDR